MSFAPIAIVGRACLLPGASSPAELYRLVHAGADLLGDAPPGRWRAPEAHVLTTSTTHSVDHTWTKRGGYVRDFSFDGSGYGIAAERLRGLDPLVHWVLDTARRALVDSGTREADTARTGAILGNLSLPSSGQARYAERVWLGELADRVGLPPTDPRDRFNSGLPAHLLAKSLGLGIGAYALDAACASSLYAVELACRALQDGSADRMLAGAVNRADDLFIHVGFCALDAMSKIGRSRPFHRSADGLVAAEGCGFVVLERLDDAVRAGRTIHGVIRGVGLANDGRGAGLLAPSRAGQERSMRTALAQAELSPSDVAYVECHATGTPVGDSVELASMTAVYGGDQRIGSLKGNLGHLITAAGIAGLIKVLESLREETMLPTPHLDEPSKALATSPFDALRSPETWRGPRRAGLSAFGFGGNDAHLIVEAHTPERTFGVVSAAIQSTSPVVVVSLGARVGDGQSVHDFERALFEGRPEGVATRVRIPLEELRFPPNDLKKTSGQQTLLLAAALEATRGLDLPQETTGVFVGYQGDPEVARWGARWRARSWGEALGRDEAWIRQLEDAFAPPLEAPGVVGSLPNIPANRLSSQLDLGGPSYTTSAEQLSGIHSLEIAVRSLRRGDLDAALVGAVDLSHEPVHQAALRAVSAEASAGDAAVVLVLMRLADANAAGLPVLAELGLGAHDGEPFVTRLGRAHAASGLVDVAAAIVAAARNRGARLVVNVDALNAPSRSITVIAPAGSRPPAALSVAEAPAGPALELDAHPPQVQLPEIPVMQKMQPAPSLPPVWTEDRIPERPAPPPAALPARTPRATANAPIVPGLVSAIVEHQTRLAQMHQEFIAQQSALHQQFIESLLAAPLAPLPPAPTMARATADPLPPTPLPARPVAPRSNGSAPHGAPLSSPHGAPLSAPHGAPLVARRREPAPAVPSPAVPSPAVPSPAVTSSGDAEPRAFRPTGPTFSREQLQVHASGTISEIFGELFQQQDGHAVQVRMPEPPLLLADRCTGLEAEPGSMKKGTCWTETDVRHDSWYLHDGHMPAGIMIESGQADLFLISYLGADFLNQGERAYRLLGCEMTWLGDLPKVGETLEYEIHVDGHAAQGDVRLFFFHYDCHVRSPDGTTRPALRVRGGQAGFFTKQELAESAGILWRPEAQEILPDARVDAPRALLEARAFDRSEIEAFADGQPWRCFGDAWARTQTHTRTPRIQAGRMLFLETIESLDPKGGPWGRGYLKAVTTIHPDEWFFDGHFKNDPCMPGTLMLEGCVQAMAFYLAAMGYTIDKDGWRFQPVEDQTYSLRCRGQVIPTSKSLTYEIFVEEVHDGPEPMLYADLLCTVDGLGAFHARRFGLKLTPSWPLSNRPDLTASVAGDERAASASYEGTAPFRFDYASLLACAWGQPSAAFGPMYERFDGTRRTARLPGPPYHFLSRVTKVEGEIGGLETGTTFELEYDVPEDAWYFDENGARVMPFAVLLEAALQPCGWVASYVGSALTVDSDLLFRNLDGTGTIKAEILPNSGTLRTVVKIKSISRSSGMIIETFDVHCYLGEVEVYELDTAFGFFPPSAFENQAGLPVTDAHRALLHAPANVALDLNGYAQSGTLRLASPFLRVIDRVTHLDLTARTIRAEKDIDPGQWFFKAHFYQDPVQPGSLGIEAMLQLLQVFMLESAMADGMKRPRFEAIAVNRQHVWKYRGQVVPENERITTTLQITKTGQDERGRFALADASLWVDGKRIYEARDLGMRIVEDETPVEELLDPEQDTWLADHCPTYTLPALPMMSMVDRMIAAARDALPDVNGLHDLRVERWIVVDGPTRLRTEVEAVDGGHEVRLLVWRDATTPALSRFEVAARARVGAPPMLEPMTELTTSVPVDPYADDRLFHGPAFHMVKSLSMGAGGSSSLIDAAAGAVPFATMNQGLLDAATHGLPHDRMDLWSDRADPAAVGYPHRLDVRFCGAPPRDGEVRCEARFVGFENDDPRFPIFRIQLQVADRVFADLRLVDVMMPKGPLGLAPPTDRRRFLRDGQAVPGVGLSKVVSGVTRLPIVSVAHSDWLPGTVRAVYDARSGALVREVAVKDHLAAELGVHPRFLRVAEDRAVDAHSPLTSHPITVVSAPDVIEVRSAGSPRLDIEPVVSFWRDHFGIGPWPVEDLYYALVERFVGAFFVEDPNAFAALRGRSVLYLGNHQVGVESLIFSIVGAALNGIPTLTLAKEEHRNSWLGQLIAHCFTWPGVTNPGVITYFDRSDPTSLPRIAKELMDHASARSLMVHVEGTRSHTCRKPVEKMSGIFCDVAMEAGVPIVPVRFVGGLPVEPTVEKLEYPVGMGRQDYYLGRPILPDELRVLPYKERKLRVIAAINGLGPAAHVEQPTAGDPALEAQVLERMKETGAPVGLATVAAVLAEREDISDEARRLTAGRPIEGSDARSVWLRALATLLSRPLVD